MAVPLPRSRAPRHRAGLASKAQTLAGGPSSPRATHSQQTTIRSRADGSPRVQPQPQLLPVLHPVLLPVGVPHLFAFRALPCSLNPGAGPVGCVPDPARGTGRRGIGGRLEGGGRFVSEPVLTRLKAQKLLDSELAPVLGCPSCVWVQHHSEF